MLTRLVEYEDNGVPMEGYLSLPQDAGPFPCVLIGHQWAGQGDQERATADRLAALGYAAMALDVYGKGVRGTPHGDNTSLIQPLLEDRALLLRRLCAAVDAVSRLPEVDQNKIAIIGYCFGGLCALDLARSGETRIGAAVSVHGLFTPPNIGPQQHIPASILILHGYDDPLASPDAVLKVAQELSEAGADWQLHAFGNTMHGFTTKGAHAPERGVMYNERSDERATRLMLDFLAEKLRS